MVDHVIKLAGSSNHNQCATADSTDQKPWCYTVDRNKRWEHCSSICVGSSVPPQPTPQPDNDDTVTGTRVRDFENDNLSPRSKYDQKGNCYKNCLETSFGSAGRIHACDDIGIICRPEKRLVSPGRQMPQAWFHYNFSEYLDIFGES